MVYLNHLFFFNTIRVPAGVEQDSSTVLELVFASLGSDGPTARKIPSDIGDNHPIFVFMYVRKQKDRKPYRV